MGHRTLEIYIVKWSPRHAALYTEYAACSTWCRLTKNCI